MENKAHRAPVPPEAATVVVTVTVTPRQPRWVQACRTCGAEQPPQPTADAPVPCFACGGQTDRAMTAYVFLGD